MLAGHERAKSRTLPTRGPCAGGDANIDARYPVGVMGGRRTNAEIAEEWRRIPFCDEPWRRAKNQAGALEGECGGLMVTKDGFGRRAYLKPTKAKDPSLQFFEVAAREKIAADLAHDLGLSVPPAQLAKYTDGCDGADENVVVSLVMYKTQWSWDQLRDEKIESANHGAALRRAIEGAAGMLVFDTWIAQGDHSDSSPHNIIWGYDDDDDDGSLVYLDFARTLSWDGSWDSGGWREVAVVPFPKLLKQHCVDADVIAMAQRIRDFPDDSIASVVDRIPESYLRPAERETIRTGLMRRKALVFEYFQAQHVGGGR
jgi:hypothetical protein